MIMIVFSYLLLPCSFQISGDDWPMLRLLKASPSALCILYFLNPYTAGAVEDLTPLHKSSS
jgi:hypothetical protein